MRKVIALATAIAVPASAQVFEAKVEMSADEKKFAYWMKKFPHTYKTAEEKQLRFHVFQANLRTIEKKNAASKTEFQSFMTPHADWTPREFEEYNRLRVTPNTREWHLKGQERSADRLKQLIKPVKAPESFDWRDKGAVNDVKDQGQCGSCWSFSTVANIEGVLAAHGGGLISLSEQQLVDCDPEDHGCNGGLPQNADDYLITRHQGLEAEGDYPYTAEDGAKCKKDDAKEQVFINQILHIDSDEDAMAQAVVQHGPVSIGINATPMQFYTGGVSQPDAESCDPNALNHGVAIVGYGVDSEAHLTKQWSEHKLNLAVEQNVEYSAEEEKTEKVKFFAQRRQLEENKGVKGDVPYWIIRNSWGAGWGESGYYRIVRGTNACGLTSLVTTAEGAHKQSKAETTDTIWV